MNVPSYSQCTLQAALTMPSFNINKIHMALMQLGMSWILNSNTYSHPPANKYMYTYSLVVMLFFPVPITVTCKCCTVVGILDNNIHICVKPNYTVFCALQMKLSCATCLWLFFVGRMRVNQPFQTSCHIARKLVVKIFRDLKLKQPPPPPNLPTSNNNTSLLY